MIIGGLQKFSTIDFPKKLAAVVFTGGCNLRCPFCHNPDLVEWKGNGSGLAQSRVLDFLRRRVGKIDGVVLSGGEPTLQADLVDFLMEVKAMGFAIKLDTNGTEPGVIKSLLDKNLLSYIAVDMKHVYSKYSRACGLKILSMEGIEESVSIVIHSGISYEFRTTMVPGIHVLSDALGIAIQLDGAKRFVVQEFIPKKTLSMGNFGESNFSREDFELLRREIESHVGEFVIRY
ncbi:MAG: anaerobic ribonucleoside-triphosphate reductase activating protein [Puniceicoccales bacterium]|jgi:pyruvate formate lyase activating enzyme|nr:anaerobic ribonucleoside-triphosphate reductase activating protein [Puniceicoccales bacterium]